MAVVGSNRVWRGEGVARCIGDVSNAGHAGVKGRYE
jgi:hypothetical protein